MNLPQQSKEIFEILSRGNFLCENSPVRLERDLYQSCEREFGAHYDFFEHLGFYLIREDGYFYFSKELSVSAKEDKLHMILEYIDLVELMLQFSSSFGVGFRTTVGELSEAVASNSVLKNSLDRLKNISKPQTLHAQCSKVFEKFKKGGFMALEDEHEERYIVLSSYHYIETFLNAIQVSAHESA
ncbi:hypothetical protein JHD50_09390 [Sulfurimonas sp. MAG313]|nr:hypothetical protein [Sulfurimonas sp. MAG313]MDF1881511.1 hypothetical protein [Sulfurimonas sp. MAG313]